MNREEEQPPWKAKLITSLDDIRLALISHRLASQYVTAYHYLHSFAGGTEICIGVTVNGRLLGVVTLGVGPAQGYRLVSGAMRRDCLTLSRLWLADELPHNSESRVIGMVIRLLRQTTEVKFLLSYADPSVGHAGIIYQATNWIYTGLSEAMPLYDIGDGVPRHSRSLSHTFGSHSVRHFANHGIEVRVIPQAAKHRYLFFLDRRWRKRMKVSELPYPKLEVNDESS